MTITLTREEAQQVLDALDYVGYVYTTAEEDIKVEKVIETLRTRLAQPEPEPYGYISRRNWKMPVFIEADNVEAAGLPYNNADYEPVFKAPPQSETWTPVEIGVDVTKEGTHVVGMYVLMPEVVRHVFYSQFHPAPQREWVELTDEEVGMLTVFDGLHHVEIPLLANFVRAIEAKLKEKNNG